MLLSFLSGGDRQGYAPQSSEFIGHSDDRQRLAQEMAQARQDAQDAVKAVWKELEESEQTLAQTESTGPGEDTAS